MRTGPEITIRKSCQGCECVKTESYAVQGDSGCDVYCTHPTVTRQRVGDTNWATPDWCPVLVEQSLAAAPTLPSVQEVPTDWLSIARKHEYAFPDARMQGFVAELLSYTAPQGCAGFQGKLVTTCDVCKGAGCDSDLLTVAYLEGASDQKAKSVQALPDIVPYEQRLVDGTYTWHMTPSSSVTYGGEQAKLEACRAENKDLRALVAQLKGNNP